jgi:hypothetical protein
MFQLRTVFAVAALALFSIAASAEEPTGDQLVDGLNGVFGKHAGTRGSHAKGQCVKGTFTPTADAPSLSTAAFLAKPVPVLGRFSFGGGDPKAKEKAKTPRGLAMRLDPAGGEPIDLVQLSVPVFFRFSEGSRRRWRWQAGCGEDQSVYRGKPRDRAPAGGHRCGAYSGELCAAELLFDPRLLGEE